MFNSQDLPHELFLTQRQITKLRNNIESNMSTDVKLSKAQIKKIMMGGGNLGSLLSKFIVPLTKVAKPLIIKVLPTLGLSAAISGINAGINKAIHGSGTTTLIINKKK